MAETMPSTPPACTEVTHKDAGRESPIVGRFLAVSRRLRFVARCTAALDHDVPWSPGFHRYLRALENAEEGLDRDLVAMLSARVLSPVDVHLQGLAWKLHTAKSLEDGEDRQFFLDQLLAWPDLLYLPGDRPGADLINSATRFCLAALRDLFDRDAPAGPTQCRFPDPGPSAPAVILR